LIPKYLLESEVSLGKIHHNFKQNKPQGTPKDSINKSKPYKGNAHQEINSCRLKAYHRGPQSTGPPKENLKEGTLFLETI
jgi:hypothetical protein